MGQVPDSAPLPRCLLVLAAVTGGALTLLGALLPELAALTRAVRSGTLEAAAFDVTLVRVAVLALAGCVIWLWAATVVTSADALRGRSLDRRGVPSGLYRVVSVACGLALAGGLATSAHAGEEPGSGHRPDRHLVDGLPLPDRAASSVHVSAALARGTGRPQPDDCAVPETNVVVVRPGDTLWELARRDLPSRADDQMVADRVREIHAANRAVIGSNPDLIQPAQRLRLPPT